MSHVNTSARKQHKKERPGAKQTLDMKHSLQLDKLEKVSKDVQTLEQTLHKLDANIAKMKDRFKSSNDDKIMDKIIDLEDERCDILTKIEACKKDNVIDYFLETSDILYKYYDILEKGSGCDGVLKKTKPVENSILNWFSAAPQQTPTAPSTQENDVSEDKQYENKASLTEKYLQRTDDNYINPRNYVEDTCMWCESTNITLIPAEGCIVCGDCHSVEHVILDHEKPSYKDPPKEISYWAYKRINHFIMEWKSGVLPLVVRCFKRVILMCF